MKTNKITEATKRSYDLLKGHPQDKTHVLCVLPPCGAQRTEFCVLFLVEFLM